MSHRLLLLFPFLLLLTGLVGVDSFDENVASVILLQLKPVQHEIGLTEGQRAKMNVYADQHRAKLKAYYEQLEREKKASPDPDKLLQMFAAMKKGVIAQLSPAQLKRLREISLQALDFEALADAVVAQRVGLDPTEEKRVRSLVEVGLKKANSIRNAAVSKATADLQKEKPKSQKEADAIYAEAKQRAQAATDQVSPQIEAVRMATRTKVMAVLTNIERAKWQQLLGRPFNIPAGG